MLIPVRAAGMLVLASLILPVRTQAQVPAPPGHAAQLEAAYHAVAAQHANASESAASAAERAQRLEAQALQLRIEAGQLQARAAHSEAALAATLLKSAQDKRTQAQGLEGEASRLRQAIHDAATQADKWAAGSGPPGKGLPQEIKHVVPPIAIPIQPAGGTGETAAAVDSRAPAPPPPPPPPATHEVHPAAPLPTDTAPSPAADFAAETTQIGELVTGSAGVSAPADGKVGTPFNVTLRVSPEKLRTLLQSLKNDHPGNTTLGKEGVKLAPEMIASVTGFGFDVSPPGDQPQAVSSTEATTWSWEINPTRSGLLTLTFALDGSLNVNGKQLPRRLYEYQQTVQIAISPAGFLEQNWQWLVTTLALPAVAAAWAFLRRARDSAGGQRQPGLAGKPRKRLQ